MTLDEWSAAVAAELGLPPISGDERREVLDLAREVAHSVLRPGAPLSAYLVGIAVGRGAAPADAVRAVTDLAHRHGQRPAGSAS